MYGQCNSRYRGGTMKMRVSLMFKSECLKKNVGEGAAGWEGDEGEMEQG